MVELKYNTELPVDSQMKTFYKSIKFIVAFHVNMLQQHHLPVHSIICKHEKIGNVLDDEVMVSVDVESLFTNVPIDAAVQAALQKFENNPSLANRTTLTPAQIAGLVKR